MPNTARDTARDEDRDITRDIQRDQQHDMDKPLTTKVLAAWIACVVTIVSVVFGVVWHEAAQNTSAELMRQNITANTAAIGRTDDSSARRNDQQEKSIIELKANQVDDRRMLVELLRKMDVVLEKVTALEKVTSQETKANGNAGK